MSYPKIAQLKTLEAFQARLSELGIELPCDGEILSAEQHSPLAAPLEVGGFRVGNRWCIHPMEGWDTNTDGSPSDLTLRRWRHFGLSGAKWIWGGEAAAVQPDGRANPRQTLATPENRTGLRRLLDELLSAHSEHCGTTDDLLVGLQLTHSGRFSRPNSKQLEPRIAYHHPLLDARYQIDPNDNTIVWTDEQLDALIDRYVVAAQLAQEAGFRFVDVKACHGYLLHEFLSARPRDGKYGGDFAGRTRLMLSIIAAVRRACPELMILSRISAFDTLPYAVSTEVGQPMPYRDLLPYGLGFGVDAQDPLKYDLSEPIELIKQLGAAGVAAVNISCGSPYYNPHIQRPAIFPPSDGYQPPEDPLVGVARQIHAVRALKQAVPEVPLVGSGYSYLQDYLPQVAQAVVRAGWVDSVGLGRMVLSYPAMPADSLAKGTLARKLVCRTFSDCTTAPRHGLVSGCYPLDAHYKAMPEAAEVKQIKQQLRSGDDE